MISNVEITKEKITHLPPLFYSCDIGTPGNEETDVQDNQSRHNTVAVFCEGEPMREFKRENRNVADYSILVSKNRAVSISKLADQAVVEP